MWFSMNVLLVTFLLLYLIEETTSDSEHDQITLIILLRNKSQYLPLFLGGIDRLTYPKDKIHLWMRTDHNSDDTADVIEEWLDHVRHQYKSVDFVSSTKKTYEPASVFGHFTEEHIQHVCNLKQAGIEAARDAGSIYSLYIEADVYIDYNETIEHLIKQLKRYRAVIMTPMIEVPQLYYSNYWCEISPEGGYQSVPRYFDIADRKTVGAFDVELVSRVWMMDLSNPKSIEVSIANRIPDGAYTELIPPDDHIQMAYTAKKAGARMMVTNEQDFGLMVQPSSFYENEDQICNVTREIMSTLTCMSSTVRTGYTVSEHIQPKQSEISKYFDHVYIINLKRRPLKRTFISNILHELGITNYNVTDAIDGEKLTNEELDRLGVEQLPEYVNPFRDGGMKKGEIACLLSHVQVWEMAHKAGHDRILILEDDANPTKPLISSRLFHETWSKIQKDLEYVAEKGGKPTPWDLMYLGRRFQGEMTVDWSVPGLKHLVYPGYSYWTVAYALSGVGIKKLLDSDPYKHCVPSDDYITIMFDQHPNEKLKARFDKRDLLAISTEPLLFEPIHFPGDVHYVSDTETSEDTPMPGQEGPVSEDSKNSTEDTKESTEDSKESTEDSKESSEDRSRDEL